MNVITDIHLYSIKKKKKKKKKKGKKGNIIQLD